MRARCPIMRRRFRWQTALVIRQNIAVLYEKEGDFAKALEEFKECQAAGADTPEVQKEIRFLESR